MKDTPHICRTCGWAEWRLMTNHTPPRIKPGQMGSCLYPDKLVDRLRKAKIFLMSETGGGLWSVNRMFIRPEFTDPCDLWTPKTTPPSGEGA